MSKFQVFKSTADGQYYYHLKSANNEIIQSGEGYTSKANCLQGITSVQRNCQPERFEPYYALGQYGFNQVATNGEIIGRSEKYTASAARDHGIEAVIRLAPSALIEDLA
ncbi:YegP family protein [Solirubrum puertoriconensis]|uniref:DUF1508 domain-containing protein n=1 Tax=Solirubrum puertoriconensis TaxID=1751427 RepID=A0A9X0HMG3_SOLP1|nr:YegP family protein [Solirubrum puertoriconensis]KUG08504.1 hypothetical protein ASU33_10100 [Solirubrum puertoriconensis]